MTDHKPPFDQNETPEDVATLYSWANLHGAKYRDFSASRAQTREQVRLRVQQALEAEQSGAAQPIPEQSRIAPPPFDQSALHQSGPQSAQPLVPPSSFHPDASRPESIPTEPFPTYASFADAGRIDYRTEADRAAEVLRAAEAARSAEESRQAELEGSICSPEGCRSGRSRTGGSPAAGRRRSASGSRRGRTAASGNSSPPGSRGRSQAAS